MQQTHATAQFELSLYSAAAALQVRAPTTAKITRRTLSGREDWQVAKANEQNLLADIGATNARFALAERDVLGPIEWLSVVDFSTPEAAIKTFLGRRDRPSISEAILAVAGPVEADHCVLTNCGWVIDGPAIAAALDIPQVRIINDFEATAFSLPHLSLADLATLGKGRPVRGAPMAVLGPGSGFGVACLVPGARGPIAVATEGGHATLSGTLPREDAVIDRLRQRFEHVSIERVLSGNGLENLYYAIAATDGIAAPGRNAAQITTAALEGTCPSSRAALDMFCSILGGVSGDLALTFGARGGIYIAGGIAPRIVTYLTKSDFRARFEAKGRLRNYLEAIPTHIICHTDAAFIGMQSLLGRRAASQGA